MLNVRNNRLTELPKEIGECKFLRIVLLGGNLLTTLPANFFVLGNDSAKVLFATFLIGAVRQAD